MIRSRRHPASARVEAFTDGVFAIAATLLVLDLTTHTIGEVSTDAELWSAVGGMWELFLNFGLSFVLLCLLWMTHVQQFEHVASVDAAMIWLNNGRLLFIVLVPFATGLATEYSEFVAGRMGMALAFFFAILFSWLQWQWAIAHREAMVPDLTDEDARAYGRGALSAVLISAAVVVLSPFVGSFAFLLFLIDPLLTRALRGR